MWATQVVAAGVLAGTIVLASCGNGGGGATADEPVSTEGTEPSGGGGPQTMRPCVVFSLEEVEAMVGNPITAGPDAQDGASGCEWTAEVLGDEGARESHVVDLQVHDVAAALDDVLTLDGQPTAVPGLGDQAQVEASTSGVPAVMAGYRDADRVVTLRYEVQAVGASTIDPRDDPSTVVETLRMLEAKIAQPAG